MLAELTPLADYLGTILRGLRPLPSLEIDLTQAYGNVIAEDVHAPGPLPAFDHAAVDGYAARCEDLAGCDRNRPAHLNVIGDLSASSWRATALTTPIVTESCKPSGLPNANTTSPWRSLL